MAHDYFAVLGLSPGRYEPREIAQRFLRERDRLLAQLRAPDASADVRRNLDELHLAYALLRDPQRQEEYLRTRVDAEDRVGALRALIRASLEDGLLRYSRRQAILSRARELGFSEFQAQLLIAQVQFGDDEIPTLLAGTSGPTPRPAARPRVWPRLAATGVVALAVFLYLVQWVGN